MLEPLRVVPLREVLARMGAAVEQDEFEPWFQPEVDLRSGRIVGFEALAPGQALRGPAIVESATTTVLLLPGDTARMDGRGWLEILVD